MEPKPVRRSRRRAGSSMFDEVLIKHLDNLREHGSEAVRRSKLKVRGRLKPFLPYLDRPQATDDTRNAGHPLSTPDAAWINLDVIRGWLDGCQTQHGDRCQLVNYHSGSTSCSPAWLIDVDRLCLVQGKPEMRYMALSYVWGTSNSACTETANLALLRQPGGLEDAVQMPKTIAHAVQLTKLLGEHYLWADRFCIVQDGGRDKQDQLDAMGDIYTGALATIVVATADDVNQGLRGIPGVTSRRFLPGHGHSSPGDPDPDPDPYSPTVDSGPGSSTSLAGVSSIGPGPANATTIRTSSARGSHGSETLGALISELDLDGDSLYSRDIEQQGSSSSDDLGSIYSQVDLGEERPDGKSDEEILVEQAHLLMESIWYSRGWTFQEQMFSRRKIIFQGETVNWECCCAAWHEAQGLQVVGMDSKRQEEHQDTSQTLIRSTELSHTDTWPDLRRFSRLICLYNRRQLTYPEDAIDAFAGVISGLNHTFVGSFISGLPQMFFHSALLWQPHWPLDRRLKRGDREEACLPSWSWVGWHGTLNSESWRSGYDYMRHNADEFHEETSVWQPSSWHTTPTVAWFYVDDAGERRHIESCGLMYRDIFTSVPSDTTPVPPLPEGWTSHRCDKSGKPFFRHKCNPDQEFWYPIPLRKATDPLTPHIRAKHLWCTTRRAVVRIGETFHNEITGQCLCADLVDDEDNWVGVLRYVTLGVGAEPRCSSHELIELSAGSVEDQETEAVSFDEWFRPGCPRRRGRYEFYNVMAIRWDGITAYRLAVGRVEKTAWERLAAEEACVTLG